MSVDVKVDLDGNIKLIEYSEKSHPGLDVKKFAAGLEGKPLRYLLEENFWVELKKLGSIGLLSDFYRYCNNHYFSHLENDGVSNEKVLCRCVSYLEKSFYKFVKENPTVQESEVAGLIQVGAGCGSCIGDVHEIFSTIRNREPTPFDIALRLQAFLNEQNLTHYHIEACGKDEIIISTKENSFSDGLIHTFMKDFGGIKVTIN